jgi:serine/threonine protein kinase
LSDLHKTKFTNADIFPQYDKLEGLLHRDLKPTNLLLDIDNSNEEVKLDIIDYADMIPHQKDGNNSDTCCGSRGYTPPEVIGDNSQRKSYTFESDYYQAGVTIAEFITSGMYQVGIQDFLKTHEPFNDYWTVGHMQALMPDVFHTKHYAITLKPNENSLEVNVNEIIYQHIIFPALSELAISMTKQEPTLRLFNSSLDDESNKLKQLERKCLDLSRKYQIQVDNTQGAQHIFADLSHILHIESNDLAVQQISIQSSLSKLTHTLSASSAVEVNALSFSI